MKELILIKLGGSIITDKKKEFTARGRNIIRLAREIREARVRLGKETFFIIGHGSGSFAHTPAARYKTKEGIINRESVFGMSVVEDAARRLNMIVVNNFLKEKLPVFSFSPASFLISDTKGNSKSYLDAITKALEVGIIPVVYGDVILDLNIGCTIYSTEKIFSVLARRLRKKYKIRIIHCADTDGVYDEKKKTIPAITGKNFVSVKKSIVAAGTTDVTGGMLHKVQEALLLARANRIITLIVNGGRTGQLKKAILGKKTKGTAIAK